MPNIFTHPSRFAARRASIGIALLLLVSLGLLAAMSALGAADREPDETIAAGTLLLRARAGSAVPAIRLGTDMDVVVTGQIARVKVVQAFRNTGRDWAEATYLYPLPEEGAVDSLKMVVGQRVIVGEIKHRAEASAIYQRAKAKGQKAGLVEEERPNMFTSRVANIGPGETVLIAIEYQAPVARRGGDYALRLPLVVGPRYVPPASLTDGPAIEDAEAVTAPLHDTRGNQPLNPVSISVRLNPGFPIANLTSSSHRITTVSGAGEERIVCLADGQVPADRDFVLSWRSAEADPTLALFREQAGDAYYLMAVVTPPFEDRKRPAPPREMVFVIDNSGSMGGDSMEQAKASLRYALKGLTPADRFNVIRFDDTMTELFDTPVAATPDQVALADRFAEGLEAAGGTEMLPALQAALVDDTPQDEGRVRQVVFLTDGAISNESEMLAALSGGRGRSRVFMIGIGSAPNNFLMNRMAEIGRGTYTNIGDTGEVNARMAALLDRLARPVVTDLAVRVEDGTAEFVPDLLPDLYLGEPLVLLARTGRPGGTLEISGRIGGAPWRRTIDLAGAAEGAGVAKLWARRRIADAEVALELGLITDDVATEEIARLGLAFSIVTRETSLVAVDKTPSRPAGARLTEEELPLNLPAGWDFDALFGDNGANAQTGGAQAADQAERLDLPETATDSAALMRGGLWLLLIGLGGLLLLRKGRKAWA